MSEREAIVRDLDRVSAGVVRVVAESVGLQLIEDTPKRTGYTASNWIPSIGQPSGLVAGAPEFGKVNVGPQDAGFAALSRYTSLKQGTIFIVNNTESIGLLNDGGSPKAPAGFVDGSIRAGINMVSSRAGSIR